MTKEKAIKRLELHKRTWLLGGGGDLCDALDKAIAALREQIEPNTKIPDVYKAAANEELAIVMAELKHFGRDTNVPTNADHIRSMTDEELARWLVLRTVYQESAWSNPSYLNFKTGMDDTFENANAGTADWLKQPYKEEA